MQLKKFVPRVLLALAALAGLNAAASADVKINEGNGVNVTMENEAVKLNIAVEAGGRISSLVNKKTGKDLVTLWKGPGEDGGLLDDRNVFTSLAYRAAVMQPGGKEGVVRLSAQHPSGMTIVKTLTLREGESTLDVQETFSNGTQKEARFMLRSFLLPGGGPLTNDDQYFVPVKDKPLEPLTPAHEYYENLAAPWTALWNKTSGEGILVAAPGIEKFYFWQGSKIFPTYEWVYPNVPAGKSITVHYALQLVNNAAPDWPQLSSALLKKLQATRFADIAGWENEEQRFKVTANERARGFWLSTGSGPDKRRVPQQLRIDVPLGQSRSVYLSLNALKEIGESDLQARFRNIPANLVQTGWQVSGADFIKVLPFDSSTKIELKNGTEGRLWLTLRGGAQPVESKGAIEIMLDGQRVLLPLHVKVWPVQVPAQQPFGLKDYAGMTSFFGGHAVTPETIRQATAMLDVFHDIGGNVLNWTVSWPNMYRSLKIEGTGETVTEWVKKNRAAFQNKPATEWPRVDFTHFDPWVEAAKARGVTRAATYLPLSTAEKPVTAELEWMLSNLKTYLQGHGFHGFHGKISDEIAPEHLPGYIESAKVARRAGWRPGTTVTGSLARSATHINAINPYCDIWEVGFGSTEFFKNLISQPYRLEDRVLQLPAKWGNYGNGGARDTIAQPLFKALIPEASSEVESMQVLQDGKPLLRVGGSPWGNQKRGVFFGDSNHLYVSPLEGTDAKQSQFEVRYQVRVPSVTGETLAKVDADDEIWFYGGGHHSYRASYEYGAKYPLKALQGDYAGYGLYDFYRWNVDKVVWYDKDSGAISVGPTYLGYRDGWNDASLMAWLAKTNKAPVSRFISEQSDAPLHIGEETQEVYRWKNIVNLTDPFVLNDARQKMLEAAVEK